MTTRNDIINILIKYETREERSKAVEEYLNKNVLTSEEREKILSDLESYAEY